MVNHLNFTHFTAWLFYSRCVSNIPVTVYSKQVWLLQESSGESSPLHRTLPLSQSTEGSGVLQCTDPDAFVTQTLLQ